MKTKELGNLYDSECDKQKRDLTCDDNFKKLLREPRVVAPIIKRFVKGLENKSLDEILKCIPADDMKRIVMMQTESVGKEGEATIYYDSHIEVYDEDSNIDVNVDVVVDLEMQGKGNGLSYKLPNRMEYYSCRLISQQLDQVGVNGENYDKLKPIYTIWIVRDSPKKVAGKVFEYSMRSSGASIEEELGSGGLQHIVAIYLPKVGNTKKVKNVDSERSIIDYLQALFFEINEDNEDYIWVCKDEKVKERIDETMGMAAVIREEGRESGIREGIEVSAAYMLEAGMTPDDISRILKISIEEVKKIKVENGLLSRHL